MNEKVIKHRKSYHSSTERKIIAKKFRKDENNKIKANEKEKAAEIRYKTKLEKAAEKTEFMIFLRI